MAETMLVSAFIKAQKMEFGRATGVGEQHFFSLLSQLWIVAVRCRACWSIRTGE
jgi:hypothetical protein